MHLWARRSAVVSSTLPVSALRMQHSSHGISSICQAGKLKASHSEQSWDTRHRDIHHRSYTLQAPGVATCRFPVFGQCSSQVGASTIRTGYALWEYIALPWWSCFGIPTIGLGVAPAIPHHSPKRRPTPLPEESTHRIGHIAYRTGWVSQFICHCIHAALTNSIFASPGTPRQQKNLLQARSAPKARSTSLSWVTTAFLISASRILEEPRLEEPRLRLDQRRRDRRRRIWVDQDPR